MPLGTVTLTSSGDLDFDPLPRIVECQYSSCPRNSGTTGLNASSPRLRWVNSFPATAVRWGVTRFAPEVWGTESSQPDLVLTGPNVGSNKSLVALFSGTVGAAAWAAREAGIPAVAFSGESGGNAPWNVQPRPLRAIVYAKFARRFTDLLVSATMSGGNRERILPEGVFLNVNFPQVDGACDAPEKFRFVLTRFNPRFFGEEDAVPPCAAATRDPARPFYLPTENAVVATPGCWASVSVGDARDRTTAPRALQEAVIAKIGGIFECLP